MISASAAERVCTHSEEVYEGRALEGSGAFLVSGEEQKSALLVTAFGMKNAPAPEGGRYNWNSRVS